MKNKKQKAGLYFLLNLVLGYVTYNAVILSSTGWTNVLYSWIGIFAIVSVLIWFMSEMSDMQETIEEIRQRGPSVPRWLDITLDILYIGFFVYHGWWIMAVLFFVIFLMTCWLYRESEQEKEYKQQIEAKLSQEDFDPLSEIKIRNK